MCTKTLLPPVKIRIFVLKNGQIWPKICFPGHIGLAGSFVALLVGGCGARAVSRKTGLTAAKIPTKVSKK